MSGQGFFAFKYFSDQLNFLNVSLLLALCLVAFFCINILTRPTDFMISYVLLHNRSVLYDLQQALGLEILIFAKDA